MFSWVRLLESFPWMFAYRVEDKSLEWLFPREIQHRNIHQLNIRNTMDLQFKLLFLSFPTKKSHRGNDRQPNQLMNNRRNLSNRGSSFVDEVYSRERNKEYNTLKQKKERFRKFSNWRLSNYVSSVWLDIDRTSMQQYKQIRSLASKTFPRKRKVSNDDRILLRRTNLYKCRPMNVEN